MPEAPTQQTSEEDINKINESLKSQPWYQNFFRQQGIDPNMPIKLSGTQQQQLAQLAAKNGMPLGARMKFDGAGNINQQGGFAGMPPWAKVAIAAAPIAATAGFGAAGMGPMAGMMGLGGGGATGAGAGLTAAQLPTGALAGTSALGGVPAVGGGGLFSSMAGRLGMMGRGLSGAGREMAAGRQQEFGAGLQMDEAALRRQAEERAARNDAFQGIQRAARIQGRTDSTPLGFAGQYSPQRRVSSPEELAGARGLEQELLQRLQGGSQLPAPTQIPRAGMFERMSQFAGPALSLFGAGR